MAQTTPKTAKQLHQDLILRGFKPIAPRNGEPAFVRGRIIAKIARLGSGNYAVAQCPIVGA